MQVEKIIYDDNFTWLDVTQPTREQLHDIAQRFHLHPYSVQDCLEPDHLPKYETIEQTRFIIVRAYNPKELDTPHSVQDLTSKVALFYSDKFLLTIHRQPQPMMQEICDQFLKVENCKLTPLDIVKRVMWRVINTFAEPARILDEEVDKIETLIFDRHVKGAFEENLYHLRRMVSIHKKLLHLCEDIITQLRAEYGKGPFLQDLEDLTKKILNNHEQIHEDVTNLLHIYISISSHKTNEVMKVLTIFSVFFMPLTFIVGIYGMNFDYMPELKKTWGYPATLGAMLVIVLFIWYWFKRKKWL
jgi:magnesium transporter